MTVKEVIDFLSQFDDADTVYVDIHDGYWETNRLHTFRFASTGMVRPAICCKCTLPINSY